MTDEPKRPQAGEFWRTRGGEIRKVIADERDTCPDIVHPLCSLGRDGFSTHTVDGDYWGRTCPNVKDLVEHLPLCDSFTWTPETWPKYRVPVRPRETAYGKPIAYICCNQDGSGMTYHTDGTSFGWEQEIVGGFCEVTEAEALARLTPPVPVESPEDWVTQDRLCPRAGCDQVRWSTWPEGDWVTASGNWECRHGEVYHCGRTLHVRCRRKHLPPLPAPEISEPSPTPGVMPWPEMRATEGRESVRLYLTAVGMVSWRYEHPSDRELFHDGKEFYTRRPSARHTSRSIDSSGQDERR